MSQTDEIAKITRIKIKLHNFLSEHQFKKNLNHYWKAYHRSVQEKNQLKENYLPFFLDLELKFGEIVDGKFYTEFVMMSLLKVNFLQLKSYI